MAGPLKYPPGVQALSRLFLCPYGKLQVAIPLPCSCFWRLLDPGLPGTSPHIANPPRLAHLGIGGPPYSRRPRPRSSKISTIPPLPGAWSGVDRGPAPGLLLALIPWPSLGIPGPLAILPSLRLGELAILGSAGL